MTKTSSRSPKRKETKPYYKYGNLEIKVFVVLFLIGLVLGLALPLSLR